MHKMKKAWTAPMQQDLYIASRKRFKPDGDAVNFSNYEPKSVAELVVHPRKIAEVREWIRKFSGEKASILLVSGPPGSGKTITLKLVAEAEGLSVAEWISPVSKNVSGNFLEDVMIEKSCGFLDISENIKFEEFVNRSSRYPSLFQPKKQTLVLVKDFPNTYIWRPDLFHAFLERYVIHGKAPIAFIVTDDENLDHHNNLFPNEIKLNFRITVIKFNAVSDTFLKKNLENLTERIRGGRLPSEYLDKITKNAFGDLRSAITEMLLQLKTGELNLGTAKRRKHDSADEEKIASDVNLMSSRDHGYEFYKKMGRILYPKRTAEEPSAKGTNFVHSVLELVDGWTKSNLSFLHENYLKTCSKLEDAVSAADCFTFCDVLSHHWEMETLSGVIAVIGLMVANTQPKKQGFLPFKKSVNFNSATEWKCAFNEACATRFGVEERIFALDVAPMKIWLPIQNVDPSIRTLDCHRREKETSWRVEAAPSSKNIAAILPRNQKEENGDSCETTSEEFEIEEDGDSSETKSEEFEIEEDED